ncbi:MFS general substrate transporter [Lindgomyces ingoldianus]|uniref:MFS general substrate transporter n=1 Tax=Lindgomyces ingoldianus TaxID=673940 RepID=A0ACB6QAI4_9PLEO|nr:MFS general substrate transporter [Lindgomyces ingoldianus]KAF2463525.1 MFS general substrate transporter [Lindgomyces ingoldianus]
MPLDPSNVIFTGLGAARSSETAPWSCGTLEGLKHNTTVDTVHQDEAIKILTRYAGNETSTAEEEKKLVRRIDRKLVSILCITYGLQYYDKAMLSQAVRPLFPNVGNRYSLPASIFYLGFIVGSYPAILMAQHWVIERVAAGIVLFWGICLMCSAVCHNWQGFYAQRFSLGFLESGISPMFMLVVGGWYKKREQALRMGAWYSCTGYVSAVSPLINYGLGHIKGGFLNNWQYMHPVAGVLTVFWSLVILLFMPPDPIHAKGFGDRERYIAVARMRQNNLGVRNTHFKIGQLREAPLDVKFWLICTIAFLMMIANGLVLSFIPIIISGFGFNSLNSLLLALPAGVIIGSIELGVPYLAYRLPLSAKGGLLFACYILASFGGGYAVTMGLQIANTAGYTKRSVTSSGIFVGYCLGNLVGPLLFKPKDAPVYAPGFIAVLITSIIVGLLTIVYSFVCIWDNQRRDESGTMEASEHAYEDDHTDKTKNQFRYTL